MISTQVSPIFVDGKAKVEKLKHRVLCPVCKNIICVKAIVSMDQPETGRWANSYDEYLCSNFENCKTTVGVNDKGVPNSLRLGGSLRIIYNSKRFGLFDLEDIIAQFENTNIVKNLSDAYKILNNYSLFL